MTVARSPRKTAPEGDDNPGTPIAEIGERLKEKQANAEAAPVADPAPAKPGKKAKVEPLGGDAEAPDFDKAVRLYRNDIKPAKSRASEFMQEASTAYKAVKKDALVHPGAAKAAFALAEMEYDKQQEWLRSFRGTLQALNIGIEADLFDGLDEAAPGSNVVPLKKPEAVELVTVQ
jgi:hypothetical protein